MIVKKNLILSALLFWSVSCFAQNPNPDIFQTWHLKDMFIQFGPPFDLMDPPVYATLTISENFDFSGIGSCNTFSGSYVYDSVLDRFTGDEFEATNEDCVFPYHNNFEQEYFEDVTGIWEYEIIEDGIGLQLNIYDLFELDAIFTNYTLSTADVEKVKVAIYPNPVADILSISSINNRVLSIEIYTIEGKNVTIHTVVNQEINNINVTHLDSGIYFLNIFTDDGRITKRIVKN